MTSKSLSVLLGTILRVMRQSRTNGSERLKAASGAFVAMICLSMAAWLSPTAASAQTIIRCDVSVTVTQGSTFDRNALNDCPGAATQGTNINHPADYIEGFNFSNANDTGNDDTLYTNGVTNPDSRYSGNCDQNTWCSADNSFTFNYKATGSPINSTSKSDTFQVQIYGVNQSTQEPIHIGNVYYHVTVVPPPPTLTNVAPAAGTTGGGTSVVLTGTNFALGATVSFGGTAATGVGVINDTQINATAPAHAAGYVNVVVTTGGGSATRSSAYGYNAPPTNSASFSPGSIATGGAATLTFTVTNPAGNTNGMSGVSFSSAIPSGLTLANAATTCIYGAAALGGGTISLSGASIGAGASCTVTASASSTAAGSYSITPGAPSSSSPSTTGVAGAAATLVVNNPAPTVSSISPTGGSSGGGTPVTITGSNFRSGDIYTVSFGATTVSATYTSATTLTATAPAGTGTVQVTVTDTTPNPDQAGTGSASYTYAAPTVTALSPTSGPAGQGRSVTITGTNFTPTASVTVGGAAATSVTYNSEKQLTATLPARPPGTYDVQVTTGTATSAATAADQYTYIAAPTVTNVSPNSGPTTGGTAVVLTGTGFAGTSAVTFGGTPAASFTVNSNTQITASTPAGTAGAATVAVTTGGGSGQLAGGYTYVANQPPSTTQQPAAQTVNAGQTATFTAQASGYPAPTVQWQASGDNGASYANIAGATAASYTTPATTAADNNKLFRATFTNNQGSATTAAARLTVVSPPVANNQTVTVAYNYAGNASNITLTASGGATSYTVLTAPAHGSLSGTAPNLVYQPVTGYNGTDSFTFQASNGAGASNTATVTITVPAPTIAIAGTLPGGGTRPGV